MSPAGHVAPINKLFIPSKQRNNSFSNNLKTDFTKIDQSMFASIGIVIVKSL